MNRVTSLERELVAEAKGYHEQVLNISLGIDQKTVRYRGHVLTVSERAIGCASSTRPPSKA